MSIWKSPVFYFGLLLVLAVGAALAAPYVVPWNSYREELQAYGAKLTGRDVSIAGNIDAVLFPWPQLTARNVTIGNPAGFSEGAFVKADEFRVTVSLAGLFNGELDVQSVAVVAPRVNLQRNASGNVNWIFVPRERVAGSGLLSRVQLDQIRIEQGIISYDDLRNGYSTVLTGLDAELSAQSILGPWRMRGDAKWRNIPVGVSVTTNAKEAGQPFKFNTKLSPVDLSYPLFALDGAWDGRTFKGSMRIDPQESKGDKGSAEGRLKPLAMQALVEASESRMSLLKIRIAPADRKDSGTLIEGDALVEFGTKAVARLDLKSPRINLDTLMGAATMQAWRDGGFLAVANSLLEEMPAKLEANYSLAVNTLTSGGQTLNDVRVSGVIQKEAIRITEFAVELPGRTVGVFDGILFPGEKSAQLAGSFKLNSSSTRDFLTWLAPGWKASLEERWTGSRGRLEVIDGKIDWSNQRFKLGNVTYRFEGTQGWAQLTSDWSSAPKLDVVVNIGQLDLDSLLPNGWSFMRDGGMAGLVASLSQQESALTRRIAMRASSVQLNNVNAQEVALDVESNPKGIGLKLLDIGNVSGARLKGAGELSDNGDGPEGVMTFNLDAANPRGFIRLMGLQFGSGQWTEVLGATALEAIVKSTPQKNGPELALTLKGSSGDLAINLLATGKAIEKGLGASVAASGSLASKDAASLAHLFGFSLNEAVGASDLLFDVNGSFDQGFALSTTLNALNATSSFEGKVDVRQALLGLSGRVAAQSQDGSAVLRAIGLPLDFGVANPLNVKAVVAVQGDALSLIDLAGELAGKRFSGGASISTSKGLAAELETDELTAAEALSLAFMPWDGGGKDLTRGFADVGSGSGVAEVFIKPLQFDPMSSDPVREAVVAIGADETMRALSITSPGEAGLKFDMKLMPKGASSSVSGGLRWPVDLQKAVASEGAVPLALGKMLLQGEFNANGRGPAAALASLAGQGTYGLEGASFPRMTLQGLAQGVATAKSPEALSVVLKNLEVPPGTDIGQRIGTISATNGEATFSAFDIKLPDAIARVAAKFDLTGNTLAINTETQIAIPSGLPTMSVTYAGAPSALTSRYGTSALAAKLGYELLAKEMAELERLQKEQEVLAAKEELQRKSDEQRFADYQSTRRELREQARVRRFHSGERDRRSSELAALVAFALKNGPSMSRVELQRHARRLEVRRALTQP